MPEQSNYDSEIRASLTKLVNEYAEPDSYFVVMANYYEHLTPGREGQRVHFAHIWFRHDSAWNVSLNDRGLLCDVKLNPDNLEVISRIIIPISHVWKVTKIDHSTKKGKIDNREWPERMHMKLPNEPPLSE